MRVYVHGAGRPGREAWPRASTADATFLDLASATTVEAKILALKHQTPDGSTLLAHSAGAVPAVRAIASREVSITDLVLVEPALYDIARGMPEIERHVGAMTEARARSEAGDLFGFWSIVRPLMFGGPADMATWDSEREGAARFASIELPWGHGVTPDMIAGVPTLVITGGWNDEYEAIAAVLASHGALHRQLVGNDHRPQDHPDFESVVHDFLTRDR